MNPLPLHGLRVVTVEQYGAGPFGSMYLADLGAEVIKIENPVGGDVSRATGPHYLGENDSQFFQTFNLNKRSMALDLKHDADRAVFHRLIATADAVMNNLRGDQPAKLGLDYAALGKLKANLVCVHLSAYGRDNARAAWPGYDYLMQAEAGYMDLTGEPDGAPARMGLSMVDYMTGVTTALALVSGVFGALKSGLGRDLDVSLFDVALHQLSYPATWYLNAGASTSRLPRSAHPATVPCQLYRTQDGWVFVMCMLQKFWTDMVVGLNRPELAQDPRFETIDSRRSQRDTLTLLLDTAFSTATTAHWLNVFQGRIPIAPVYDLPQALDNPWLREIGMLQSVLHPHGPLQMLANPIRVDGKRLSAHACPAIGADNAAIAQSLT